MMRSDLPTLVRIPLALVALALLAAPTSAQSTAVLTGSVVDAASGEPLPGAAVRLPALARGAAADADGRFRLADLPADTATVVVTYVGFETQRQSVDLRSGAATLDVRLTPVEDALGRGRGRGG